VRVKWNRGITLDAYQPLYDSDATINLIWGGRDSGKSRQMPHFLVRKALTHPGFKCMLIRKRLNTVQESMFSEVVGFLEKNRLAGLVHSTKSPLKLRFKNGATFLGRGTDDMNNIKSTKEPSDAWIEEADQISEDDFDTIFTTLRSSDTPVQVWMTFNPEVDESGKNWIIDRFLGQVDDIYAPFQSFVIQVDSDDGPMDIKVNSIHTTCDDNPYCTPERRAILESYRETNVNKYNVWRLGKVGQREVASPFMFAFDEAMIQEAEIDPKFPLILSFDFNVAPATCTLSQQDDLNRRKWFVGEVRIGSEKDKANIYEVCERLRAIIPRGQYIEVTGDATGRNLSTYTTGNLHHYDIIEEELGLMPAQVKTPAVNPSHSNSYAMCNAVLRDWTVTFDPSMRFALNDLRYVEYQNGKILKREAERRNMGHLLDCIRYDLHTFCDS